MIVSSSVTTASSVSGEFGAGSAVSVAAIGVSDTVSSVGSGEGMLVLAGSAAGVEVGSGPMPSDEQALIPKQQIQTMLRMKMRKCCLFTL